MSFVKAGFWTGELDCGLDYGLPGLWTKIWTDVPLDYFQQRIIA